MNKFLYARVFVGFAFVIILLILSILANMTGWSGGAEKILMVSLVLIGTIPIGTFFTEPNRKM